VARDTDKCFTRLCIALRVSVYRALHDCGLCIALRARDTGRLCNLYNIDWHTIHFKWRWCFLATGCSSDGWLLWLSALHDLVVICKSCQTVLWCIHIHAWMGQADLVTQYVNASIEIHWVTSTAHPIPASVTSNNYLSPIPANPIQSTHVSECPFRHLAKTATVTRLLTSVTNCLSYLLSKNLTVAFIILLNRNSAWYAICCINDH